MRDKEDELMQTEEHVRTRESALDRREMELTARMEQHQEVVLQFDRQCEQRVRELDQEQAARKAELERAQWDIVEGREQLERDRQAFQEELNVRPYFCKKENKHLMSRIYTMYYIVQKSKWSYNSYI